MSGFIERAKREMDLAWPDSDEMQDQVKSDVIQLLECFADQGHSGMSAQYVLQVFERLAKQNSLTPLTGEDEEWQEVHEGTFQNIRDSEVFRDGVDGQAYWMSGNVFRDQDGNCFLDGKSRVPIHFPWTKPEPTYVDVYEKRDEQG